MWMTSAAIMLQLLSQRNSKTVIHHWLCCIDLYLKTNPLQLSRQVAADSWAKTFELHLSDAYLLSKFKNVTYELAR